MGRWLGGAGNLGREKDWAGEGGICVFSLRNTMSLLLGHVWGFTCVDGRGTSKLSSYWWWGIRTFLLLLAWGTYETSFPVGGNRPPHGHVAILGREIVSHSINKYLYCLLWIIRGLSWVDHVLAGERNRIVSPVPLQLSGSQSGL